MKIFITGGLGFVGRNLSRLLLDQGHFVAAMGRSRRPRGINHENFRYVCADGTKPGDWQEEAGRAEVAINLAGATIFRLWTEDYKKKMYDSRIHTTRNLVDALAGNGNRMLLSASAVGYYGDRSEMLLEESAPPGDDFLARLSQDWEAEALRASGKNVRVALPRFGIVLGEGGGAMEVMIPAFRLLMGGSLGSGRQWFPWIHMQDLTSAFLFLMGRTDMEGPVNFCAPNPVRNQELTKALADALNRPAKMPAPAFMIKIALGDLGEALLNSQRVIPKKLLEQGFAFRFPRIEDALRQIIAQRDARSA